MTRARKHTGLVVALTVLTWLAGGCSSSSGQPPASFPRYSFSCCAAEDLHGWYPGKNVNLHWTVQSAGSSTDSRDVPITITATLAGPYSDVISLKSGAPAAKTIRLATLIADNRVPTPLTSTFTLPSDLGFGFYNLAITNDYGGGNSSGSGDVIQVSASGSAPS
jgi:hypothetical protein